MYQDRVADETALSAEELENSFPLDVGRRFNSEAGLLLRDDVLAAMAAKEEATGERKRKRRPSAEKRLRDTVEALLCNLAASHLNEYDPDRYVGVSFNTSAYSYTGLDAVVMRSCRDHLLEDGLIEVAAGFRNHAANFGRRSRLRASPRLRNLIDDLGLGRRSLTIASSQIIRIKQAVEDLPPIPNEVEASRDLLSAINARLAVTDIRLDAGLEEILKASLIEDEGEDQDARDRKRRYAGDRTAKALYRAFKHDWGHGGRIYGGWWMSEKRVWRPYLRIDGQRTVELDYKVLHPRLLYRRAEAAMPSDPYLCGVGLPRICGTWGSGPLTACSTEWSATRLND